MTMMTMMMMMTGVMTWRDNRRARVLVVKLLSLRFMFMPQRLSLTFTMPMTAMTRPISYVWPTKPFWLIKQSTQCPVHTQCCVFPKSGVDQQEGAGCWKRSMIILGIWCIFELLLAVLCSVLCRAELGGWLPYVGLKGLAPAVSTKELPAQIYLSASCSWLVRSSPFISSLDQTSVHHSASSTIRNSLKITNLA